MPAPTLPPVIPLETPTGRYLLFSSPDMINSGLMRCGAWDPVLVETAQRLAEAAGPGTIIDVGANLGAVAIDLARRLPPGFTHHGFEIQRIVFYQLCGNIILNRLENVHAHQVGLSAEAGTIPVPLPDYATDDNIGAYSARQDIRRARQAEAPGMAADMSAGVTEAAEMRTLDSFGFSDVRLIKIDVEGMELEVLNGARETLARNGYPPLLLEVAKDGYPPEVIARSNAMLAHVTALGYGCRIFGALCIAQHASRPVLEIELSAAAPGVPPPSSAFSSPRVLPEIIPMVTSTGRYLLFDGQDLINDTLRRTGAWEPWVADIAHGLLTQLDPRPGTIIDAGANLGAISISLARRLPPAFTFHCFEIQRIVFYQLCGNVIFNSLANIHTHHLGLGATDGRLAIPRPDYATDRNIGAVSASATVRSLRDNPTTDREGAATEQVDFRRLDAFGFDDVRLIKADVEGMELEILKGGAETLARCAYPPLLLEIWKPNAPGGLTAQTDALLSHLGGLGYGCQTLGALCIAQHRSRAWLKIHWDNEKRVASFARREP